jgi:Twin arginine targeting (Tat) protein translocase TatC
MATSEVERQNLLTSGSEDNDDNDPSAMSLVDHLEELRWRILKSGAAIVVGAIVAFIFWKQIMGLLAAPLPISTPALNKLAGPDTTPLITTGIGEAFTVALKLSFVCGVILALPVILYQAWAFIAPGLYKHEKKHAVPFICIGVVLFVIGVTIGYIVLRYPVIWLTTFGSGTFTQFVSAGSYLTFTSFFLLLFGLVFELPLILTFLAMIGIVTPKMLVQKRAMAHLGMWIAATFCTPGADFYSPIFVGVSLSILYELSIILIKVLVKPDRAALAE